MSPGYLLTLALTAFAACLGLILAAYTAGLSLIVTNVFLLIGELFFVVFIVLGLYFLRATWKEKLGEFREGLAVIALYFDQAYFIGFVLGKSPRFEKWADLAKEVRWPPNLTGRVSGIGKWKAQTWRHLDENTRTMYQLAHRVGWHEKPEFGKARRSMSGVMDLWALSYHWPGFQSFFSKHVLGEYSFAIRAMAYIEIAVAEDINPMGTSARPWERLGAQWPKSL